MTERKRDDFVSIGLFLFVVVSLSLSGILLSIQCAMLDWRVDELEQQVAEIAA